MLCVKKKKLKNKNVREDQSQSFLMPKPGKKFHIDRISCNIKNAGG